MEILSYYDKKKNRKRDFTRYQISHDGNWYIFEELLCHNFGEETASEKIDRQEFKTEQEARLVYEMILRGK